MVTCVYLFRITNGLDRSWEAHRIEGMEMLQHSVEILKERQGRRQPSLPDRTTHAVTRYRSKSRSDGNRCHNQTAEPFNLPVRDYFNSVFHNLIYRSNNHFSVAFCCL